MKNLVSRFVKDESGATAIEYGLIAAGIAVAIIAAVNTLGGTLNNTFTNVNALEAPNAFRMPGGIIQRGEAAAGDAEQVEFLELEMIRQHGEIAGNTARLLAGGCDSSALAPAPAIEGDDAIAGR